MHQPDTLATDPNASSSRGFRNRILSALPPAELALVEPHLERLELERRALLYDSEAEVTHVHFVEHGIVSILSVVGDGSAVETATIGYEGMIGMAVFHGVDRVPEQAMMQTPGIVHRMPAETFRALLPQLPTMSAALHRFAAFLFSFAAQNSGCNRKHSVEQRCARWLLTVHDRIEGDEMGLTHDFVSQMLGVRRASVTETLNAFGGRNLIAVGRARITMLDRGGLEEIVCECYRIVASAHARMLEGTSTPSPLDRVETARDGFSVVGDGTPIAASLDEPMASIGER